MSKNEINVFFSSDNKYSKYLCTLITSILINSKNNETFNFFVLDGGISDKNKEKILDLKNRFKDFNIEFLPVSTEEFEKYPLVSGCSYISLSMYYRFLIPKLKLELDKVLYLDCDIIVNGSLSDLWNIDLENTYCAVVEDINAYFKDKNANRLGLNKYFNSGVMLINNRKCVEENIFERLVLNIKELKDKNLLVFGDQDVLNYTFKDNIKLVSPKYNLQQNPVPEYFETSYSQEELEEAQNSPVIIHYNGVYKPWKKPIDNYSKIYFKYYYEAGYKLEAKWLYVKRFLLKQKDNIFSIKNENYKKLFKIIRIFGIKIKTKNPKAKQNKKKFVKPTTVENIRFHKDVANVHLKVFPQFRNINMGKDVVILATGSSMKKYKPIENAIHIGVNQAVLQNIVDLDYYFTIWRILKDGYSCCFYFF